MKRAKAGRPGLFEHRPRTTVGFLFGIVLIVFMTSPAMAQTPRTETFTIILAGGDNAPGTVVASGPISGVGKDVSIGGGDTHAFVFPQGRVFTVATFTSETPTDDPLTCVQTDVFGGTFLITGGTGAFAGATGSGTFTGDGTIVTSRRHNGGCSQHQVFGLHVIHATGTVSVPAQTQG